MLLAERYGSALVVNDSYDLVSYLDSVVGHKEQRCRYCFELRLGKTAKEARKRGFDYFTTTILISPHQKHNLVKNIGNKLTDEAEISFLYSDLRKHYSESRHITKPMDLYRQQYCGCVYSKWERFIESKQGGNS
jgi:predicted adenine nucleotide alpha hydrolase (AANH) superfamily ATPase